MKMAKNGNVWSAMKTAAGSSKMVQLDKAESVSATTRTVTAFIPATMMMAAALYSIERSEKNNCSSEKRATPFRDRSHDYQISLEFQRSGV